MKNKILIVDDEASTRFLLSLMLRKEFRVETASDTISALEKVKKEHFDVILMDINLGKHDSGITAFEHIRKVSGYENVPIIAVTAYALSKDKDNFIHIGFSEYIAKPFEKEELLALVEKVLDNIQIQKS